MKKISFIPGFIICFFGAFINNLTAQDYKNFDLSKFYTPDIVRNQLDIVGSSDGWLNSSSNSNVNISSDNAIKGNLSATFSNYVSTRKLIRTINGGIGLGGNAAGNNDFFSIIKQQSGGFSNSGGIGTSYQLFNNAIQFLSFGGNLNYGYNSWYSNKTNNINNADRSTNNSFNGRLYLYAGAGIGRIEIVTDAQQAIYLIDAFSKNKILNRDLSSNEIFSLSQEISRLKNKRFLDSRLHLIDEVSHIDSFLIANNLITKSDARYFTTLYDIWLYGDKFERKSGSSLELRLSPNINFNNSYSKNSYQISNDSNSEVKGNSSSSYYNLSLNYQYEKPVNQKWQHSINASMAIVIANYIDASQDLIANMTTNNSNETKNASASASYKLGFYPNTRTNIFAQVSEYLGYNFSASSIFNGITQSYLNTLSTNTSLNCGMYYYFSPQLQLSAALTLLNGHDIQYNTGNPYVLNGFSSTFSVGINYSFF